MNVKSYIALQGYQRIRKMRYELAKAVAGHKRYVERLSDDELREYRESRRSVMNIVSR